MDTEGLNSVRMPIALLREGCERRPQNIFAVHSAVLGLHIQLVSESLSQNWPHRREGPREHVVRVEGQREYKDKLG
jgi:hypothetical protein